MTVDPLKARVDGFHHGRAASAAGRHVRSIAGLAALVLLAGCATIAPSGPRAAAVTLRDGHGAVVGTATLTEVGGAVRVVLEVRGLAAGVHGVHVHEIGRCEPPTFTSAGGHFNPDRRQHGLHNPRGPHAGDLPNITVGGGIGRLETTTERFTIRPGPTSVLDANGSALIVHGSPDDERTDPTGNSGSRAACGVIVGIGAAATGGLRAEGVQSRA